MKKVNLDEVIDAIMGEPTDAHYPSWYAAVIREKVKPADSVMDVEEYLYALKQMLASSDNDAITRYQVAKRADDVIGAMRVVVQWAKGKGFNGRVLLD